MLRAAAVALLAAAAVAAGCSIDRVEWESTGYAVDEVARYLTEKHHVDDPAVECIKREVEGLLWECRAHASEEAFECEIHFGPRKVVRQLHCEAEGAEH